MTTTEIAVLGVGMHKWGKFPGKDVCGHWCRGGKKCA